MTTDSDSKPKPSKVEAIKTQSDFLRGTILEGLADTSTGAIAADDTQLSKFHGIYQQDDRDPPSSIGCRQQQLQHQPHIIASNTTTNDMTMTIDGLAGVPVPRAASVAHAASSRPFDERLGHYDLMCLLSASSTHYNGLLPGNPHAAQRLPHTHHRRR